MCLVRREKAEAEKTLGNRDMCCAGLNFFLFLSLQTHSHDFYLLQGILDNTECQKEYPKAPPNVVSEALVVQIVCSLLMLL